MKCKACGLEEHEGHADDCPWTQLAEMELERDSAVEALEGMAIGRGDGNGWALDYDTVKAISDATKTMDWVGMEGAEAVMLAMVDRGLAILATWKAGRA